MKFIRVLKPDVKHLENLIALGTSKLMGKPTIALSET